MSDVPPPPPPTPPPHATQPTAAPQAPPWGAGQGGGGRDGGLVPAPGAVASVVFGVLGVTVLPLIGSIIALPFGYQSRNAARDQPDRYSDQLGRVGRILGWLGLALTLGMLVLMALAALLFMGGWFFTVR